MAPTTPPPANTGATADLGQMSNDPETDRRMRTEVVKAIEPGRDRMRVCYNDALRANTKLKGEVSIRLTVAPSGDPVVIDDEGSTVRDKDFVDCVRSVLSKLQYPRWQGKAVTVVVPIEFYRSTDPGRP